MHNLLCVRNEKKRHVRLYYGNTCLPGGYGLITYVRNRVLRTVRTLLTYGILWSKTKQGHKKDFVSLYVYSCISTLRKGIMFDRRFSAYYRSCTHVPSKVFSPSASPPLAKVQYSVIHSKQHNKQFRYNGHPCWKNCHYVCTVLVVPSDIDCLVVFRCGMRKL